MILNVCSWYDQGTETSGPGAVDAAPDPADYLVRGADMADAIPPSYVKPEGYVRVRIPGHPEADQWGWAYEHRVVAHDHFGPIPLGCQVHHVNRDRSDNRPANLQIVTPEEHGEEHRVVDYRTATDQYVSGRSTLVVAAELGVSHSTVNRALSVSGVDRRTISEAKRVAVDDERLIRLHSTPGYRVPQIANALGVGAGVVRRRMRELGLPSFPPGRPDDHRWAHDHPEQAYGLGLMRKRNR